MDDSQGGRSARRDLPHPDVEEIDLTGVLAALADPARLAIVRAVAQAPPHGLACEAVGGAAAKSTRSHQLKVLREAGVVRTTPTGRHRMVTLRSGDLEQRFPGLLRAVLAADPPRAVDDASHG
ncbi:ArsR/SmtB family transcription factor [Quadrisphaera setariae]|uniref:Winged helix-turn-helix transcriptional regulator n=1 Tax=Quadrisphaera setariae TaxID=2593304 RepID=A0A5C8ZJS2_9ACTN|nr:helix-turn-helix domain-containing protein [Quadrisphaera setariae]TXR57090.1 winged helix-turn-helix transcriptional regulator [Quadrisphaera setariae]